VANKTFSQWLTEETDQRGWTFAELARRAELAQPTISLVVNGQKNPGPRFCRGIARALRLPPEAVFRKAGLLPANPQEDQVARDLMEILPLLSDESLELLLHAARGMLQESAGDQPKAEGTGAKG
jgi:transcriptional regulator with XRE-family HTH domain